MSDTLRKKLQLISTDSLLSELTRINRGIEKEGLRITPGGELAQTDHPEALGSALTHPYITTDYSEALLEFITPVFQTPADVISFLDQTHRFCHLKLENELIWAASMPCFLGGESSIPIACYGSSNTGRLKHIYREGLAWRYGKMMQTIAGIHYNFSLPESFWGRYQAELVDSGRAGRAADFQTEAYFSLIRNFRRYSWLVLYLFGASPALCPSFLQGREHQLEKLNDSLHLPFATSLRMGDLGYNSSTQENLGVCYNTLDSYAETLGRAINTSYAPYEEIGVFKNGEYRQLNSNILQIENEYYSDIRPKRVTPAGQKPLQVLVENGVEYIEIRSLDIDPYLPLGISEQQVHFLDCLLLYCLLQDSPATNQDESKMQEANNQRVANRGREPGLKLKKNSTEEVLLSTWGDEIFNDLLLVAQVLDRANQTKKFTQAIDRERNKLHDASLTPSARIIDDLSEASFFRLSQQQSVAHREYFLSHLLPGERQSYFSGLARQSLAKQAELEAQDQLAFADYLRCYLEQ